MNDIADEALMQAYVQGEFTAFEALYQRHKGGVYRYLLRQCQEQGVIDDLFQEIWAKVIGSASTYQGKAKFTTWLYTIAHNKVVDQVRHLSVVNNLIDASDDLISNAASEINLETTQEAFDSVAALKHCLGKMPQVQLDSFLLREEGNLAVAEVAQVMQASLEATKSRLRYAYKTLRHCIETKLGKQVA